MKLKPLILATALALTAFGAYAEDKTYDIALTGPSSQNTYTAGFEVQHTVAGAFTDTFTFTPSVSGFFKGSLVTTGANHADNINFISATINGVSYAFSPTGINEWGFTNVAFGTGPLVLTLFGIAGPDVAAGSSIAASYSGTLNVSAVPEPETYAMMLAGLGFFGVMARRRKKSEDSSIGQIAAA